MYLFQIRYEKKKKKCELKIFINLLTCKSGRFEERKKITTKMGEGGIHSRVKKNADSERKENICAVVSRWVLRTVSSRRPCSRSSRPSTGNAKAVKCSRRSEKTMELKTIEDTKKF